MFTDKEWEYIRAAQQELEDVKDPYVVAQVMWVAKDGSTELEEIDYCHASFNSRPPFGSNTLTAISSFQEPEGIRSDYDDYDDDDEEPYEGKFKDKDKIKYAKWLIEQSPYRSCFLNTSPEDCLNGYILDLSSPNKLIVGACIATRIPSEWPRRFEVWLGMVDQGVDPTEAYVFCMFISSSDKKFYITSSYTNHLSLSQRGNKQYYRNFIEGNYEKTEPWNKVFKYGFDTESIWGNTGGSIEPLKKIKPPQPTQEKQTNIFYKDPMAENYKFTRDQLPYLAQEMRKVLL